jgi:succinoglycan biosynthesis protein ExoM
MKITICINTFNRNKNLLNLLQSIEKIYFTRSHIIKILIIDNTVNNSSYSFIQKFKSNYKFEITHLNEKKKGIVHSRNKCLKYLKTTNQDYICLFDDDCVIDKFWLKHVINTIKIYKAKIVSGPQIHSKKNTSINSNNRFIYQNFFEKIYVNKIKKIKWAATNNIFMKYDILKKNNLYFDINLNKFKIGEDQLFFSMLNKKKNCIYWNKKAIVYEKIHENRTGIKWLINRSFKLGVLGHYIDMKLHGNFFGLLLNYLKSIYYLLKSIFFSLLMFKKIYIINSANNLARFYGRTIGIFVFKKIKF